MCVLIFFTYFYVCENKVNCQSWGKCSGELDEMTNTTQSFVSYKTHQLAQLSEKNARIINEPGAIQK